MTTPTRGADSARSFSPSLSSGQQRPLTASVLRTICGQLLSAWRWVEGRCTQQNALRRLRVAETISLGEKRFVSIVQVDGAQYLIGGSAATVSLLAVLDKQQDFKEALRQHAGPLAEQA